MVTSLWLVGCADQWPELMTYLGSRDISVNYLHDVPLDDLTTVALDAAGCDHFVLMVIDRELLVDDDDGRVVAWMTRVQRENRNISVLLVANYGPGSSFNRMRLDDVLLQAAGMWAMATGTPERGPLPTSAPLPSALIASSLAAIALSQILGFRMNAATAAIWYSRVEVMLVSQPFFDLRQAAFGIEVQPAVTSFPMLLAPSSDGFLGVNVLTEDQWRRLCEFGDHPEFITDERFLDSSKRSVESSREVLNEVFLEWAKDLESYPTFLEGQRRGIPLGFLPPEAGSVEANAAAEDSSEFSLSQFLVSQSEPTRVGRIPRNIEVSASPHPDTRVLLDLDTQSGRIEGDSAEPSRNLLANVKVLDFSMFWAGPLATQFLALMGAEVLKVEGPTSPDGWRRFGLDAHGRSYLFETINQNKVSAHIDMKSEEGRAKIHELLKVSHIVVDNFRAGVLDRAGIDDDLMAASGGVRLRVTMPAFGSHGPFAAFGGFAPTVEVCSGLPHWTKYSEEDVPHLLGNSVADPAAGWLALAHLLRLFYESMGTTDLVHLDVSQVGLLASVVETGSQPERVALSLRCRVQHGTEWVLLSLGEGEFLQLRDVLRSQSLTAGATDQMPEHYSAVDCLGGVTLGVGAFDAFEILHREGFRVFPIFNCETLESQESSLCRSDWFLRTVDERWDLRLPGLPCVTLSGPEVQRRRLVDEELLGINRKEQW